MKYVIEKNTVSETLVIPLYARKMCSECFPNIYRDETALRLIDKVDYDFASLSEKSKGITYRFGFLEVAMRQKDIAWEVCDYLKAHPKAAVVNLGCGLDDTGRVCDNGMCKIYNIDFPSVIDVRNSLLPGGEREVNIACDLNDTSWMKEIDRENGAVFFAAGVFWYLLEEQVHKLVTALSERFPHGKLVFDAANKFSVSLMLKTWIKQAQIKNVGAYFSVDDAERELSCLGKNIKVTSRGYMLGYCDLKDPSVSRLFRLLAKLGDRFMKMQIVRIDFGGN